MSAGLQGILRDALAWVAVAFVLALMVINFDTLRAFNRQLLGIDEPVAVAGAPHRSPDAEPVTQMSRIGDQVELTANDHGHFDADAEVNGRRIPLMVDTGASLVVLTYEDAERAGVFVSRSDFTAKSQTANGLASNALVTLDEVCVESVCVDNVRAMVAEPGRLHVSLLGMTFLGRLRRVDMRAGRLSLEN